MSAVELLGMAQLLGVIAVVTVLMPVSYTHLTLPTKA